MVGSAATRLPSNGSAAKLRDAHPWQDRACQRQRAAHAAAKPPPMPLKQGLQPRASIRRLDSFSGKLDGVMFATMGRVIVLRPRTGTNSTVHG